MLNPLQSEKGLDKAAKHAILGNGGHGGDADSFAKALIELGKRLG